MPQSSPRYGAPRFQATARSSRRGGNAGKGLQIHQAFRSVKPPEVAKVVAGPPANIPRRSSRQYSSQRAASLWRASDCLRRDAGGLGCGRRRQAESSSFPLALEKASSRCGERRPSRRSYGSATRLGDEPRHLAPDHGEERRRSTLGQRLHVRNERRQLISASGCGAGYCRSSLRRPYGVELHELPGHFGGLPPGRYCVKRTCHDPRRCTRTRICRDHPAAAR